MKFCSAAVKVSLVASKEASLGMVLKLFFVECGIPSILRRHMFRSNPLISVYIFRVLTAAMVVPLPFTMFGPLFFIAIFFSCRAGYC